MNPIPDTRKYTRSHIWIEMEDEFIGKCGIAGKYLDIIDTIEFVEFPETGIEVRMGEKVGSAELREAFLAVHSPVSGRIISVNNMVENDPSIINVDPYGNGWIFKIDVKEPNELRDLLDEDQYHEYLENGGDI